MFDSNDNYLDYNENAIQKSNNNKTIRFLSDDDNYSEDLNLHMDFKCQCKAINNNDNNIDKKIDDIDYEHLWPLVKSHENCYTSSIFAAIGAIEGMYKLKTGKYLELSEQSVIDCDKVTDQCITSFYETHYESLLKNKIAFNSEYPY